MPEAFAPQKAGSAAAHLVDAESRNLRRNASGHDAVVMDADLVADTEMARLVAVHQHFLPEKVPRLAKWMKAIYCRKKKNRESLHRNDSRFGSG